MVTMIGVVVTGAIMIGIEDGRTRPAGEGIQLLKYSQLMEVVMIVMIVMIVIIIPEVMITIK